MSIKNDVLDMLEKNRDKYLSGNDIATSLGVSRNAVWKAVKALQNDGYEINGINNKGYKLENINDVITGDGIKKYIDNDKNDINITVYKIIDSTNNVLKKMALEGASEWNVAIAEEQTGGKGRMNRKFHSPAGTGIYMSILLRPEFAATESLFITTMTAVATAEALEKITEKHTDIKWVNDIFVNQNKICGILTEGSINMELNKLDYAVVGIGINLRKPKGDFPDEIKNIAGAVLENDEMSDVEDLRNRVIAEIINNMKKYYNDFSSHSFMKVYKEKSILIGKNVYILSDENKENLRVLDVDDEGALVVEKDDGTIMHLSSGEVSVRLFE